ncbi:MULTISPECIES: CPBP family intramembrane glutamic endopeptidase [Clostridium]|uniref:CPBP family intramembrane glutamic endopeptidase n=1 Tax=Clostridium TaxID=1485 RepID=UPI0023550C85|nr:CPBP family intramembrane glutamic endopeptidase [Clostridium luticellarii]MCI1946309.1 CPBP family intramembrane metalloprotease [Clostridium luticellarii]MCI1969534.1 CPBP family intramembrane metalloprotease [Clostridium luticellarii]
MNYPVITFVLILIYAAVFIIKYDGIKSVYNAVHYLIAVAFTEELLFRAYLFTSLESRLGEKLSVIVSGTLWGAAHSIIGIILYHRSVSVSVLSMIIGYIIANYVFVKLLKKTDSIYIPILVHALLDYF